MYLLVETILPVACTTCHGNLPENCFYVADFDPWVHFVNVEIEYFTDAHVYMCTNVNKDSNRRLGSKPFKYGWVHSCFSINNLSV